MYYSPFAEQIKQIGCYVTEMSKETPSLLKNMTANVKCNYNFP